jgi:hypothetical protein
MQSFLPFFGSASTTQCGHVFPVCRAGRASRRPGGAARGCERCSLSDALARRPAAGKINGLTEAFVFIQALIVLIGVQD